VRFETEESGKGLAYHCQFEARAGRGVVPHGFIPSHGDVEMTIGVRTFVDVRADDGSVLHATVESPLPLDARVFTER
jgi:hypothetical protein